MKGVVLAALHLVRLPVWHRNTVLRACYASCSFFAQKSQHVSGAASI